MAASVFTATTAAGTAWTQIATGGAYNRYGFLLFNGPNDNTSNTVNVQVAFDPAATYGYVTIKPDTALPIDPSDAGDVSKVYVRSADVSTPQQVKLLVSGAR